MLELGEIAFVPEPLLPPLPGTDQILRIRLSRRREKTDLAGTDRWWKAGSVIDGLLGVEAAAARKADDRNRRRPRQQELMIFLIFGGFGGKHTYEA